MQLSVFDIFKVGIGPSSSHTVGPMLAARQFVLGLRQSGDIQHVQQIRATLYGSLAATGIGHASDRAVVLGLAGHQPDSVEPQAAAACWHRAMQHGELALPGGQHIAFRPREHVRLATGPAPHDHPNCLRFEAFADDGTSLAERTFLSVGGGFVTEPGAQRTVATAVDVPFSFSSASQLLQLARAHGCSLATIGLMNERARLPAAQVRARLLELWAVMDACIDAGCRNDGVLPGPMRVPRRAPKWKAALDSRPAADPLDWLNLYAMAVNEENAAGGRVVTAPTNGAAGIVPAVLKHHLMTQSQDPERDIETFLLTAGLIGMLFKHNASISGAEVGCQGEVGVACSMAAAGLCAVLGGTPAQVENAAEIGMEHNLGLTCDPVGGQVQIPCIERNAMGAVKAVNAARLALAGDGQHVVSLDNVIRTMAQTGADMKRQYKETSLGGLAVNVTLC